MPVEKVSEGKWRTRLRYGAGLRGRFVIAAKTRAAAEERASLMARMANELAGCGKHAEAKAVLEEAGVAKSEAELREIEEVIRELCAEGPARPAPRTTRTFGDVVELWLSGELHRQFPDRVRPRTPDTVAKDRQRWSVLRPALDKRITDVTLADARAAMALVPPENKQGTRRLYAQFIFRVMKLARYPLELIENSPIPPEFVPPQGDPPLFQFLRPDEELKLLRHEPIDLVVRLAYGFMSREGLRSGGIAIVRWSHVDLESGLFTHRHKTRRPRRWKLGDDVLSALRLWRTNTKADADLVFKGYDPRNAARRLRDHLLAAGVTRASLHERGDDERPMRAHDLRATFVTLALANGRSESWVQDRTGHADAATMGLYRRMARQAEELHLPWLSPLDAALASELSVGQRVGHGLKTINDYGTAATTLYSHTESSQPSAEPKEATASASSSTGLSAGPAGLSGVGQESVVEIALAAALEVATKAQRWDVVLEIARELRERRLARAEPGIPSLDAARAKKRDEGSGK